jgi:Zn-finger nucleic acid-binding protein
MSTILKCPRGHEKDTRRFISVAMTRKVSEKHADAVEARICPDCGSVFVDTEELRRIWPNYQ